MLRLTRRVAAGAAADGSLTLTLDQRVKSRLRVRLDDGSEAGLFLERGVILRHGDLLGSDDGRVIAVQAAPETVSTVQSADPLLLSRACYHLGNRHVPLQIAPGFVRYQHDHGVARAVVRAQHDHVLDGMLRALGLTVVCEQAPFEPEAGAYSGHGHSHQGHHDHAC